MQNKSKQSKIKKMSTRKSKQSKIKKMSTRKLKQSKTKKMSTRKLKGYGEGEGIRFTNTDWFLKVRPESIYELSFELPEYEDSIKRGVWIDLIEKIFKLNKKYNNEDKRVNKEYLYKIYNGNPKNMTDKEYELEFEKILNAKFKLFPEYKTDFKKAIGSKSEGTRFYRTWKPVIFPEKDDKIGVGYREMEALQKLLNLNEKFNNTSNMSEKDYKIEVKKILGTGYFYKTLKEMMVI
jgi:hypothetical protein